LAQVDGYRPVMTPTEVAEVTDYSVSHIRLLAAKGTLPAFKVGSEWRFLRRVIGRVVIARQEGSGEPIPVPPRVLAVAGDPHALPELDAYPDAMSVPQVATLLRIEESTTRAHARSGVIAAFKARRRTWGVAKTVIADLMRDGLPPTGEASSS
jgi:excisionase family DNA binding protein